MGLFRNFATGLRSLFRGKQLIREMDEELRVYLDSAVEEKMRRGIGQAEALRAARIEMGSQDAVKQKMWSVGCESILADLWSDIRYGL